MAGKTMLRAILVGFLTLVFANLAQSHVFGKGYPRCNQFRLKVLDVGEAIIQQTIVALYALLHIPTTATFPGKAGSYRGLDLIRCPHPLSPPLHYSVAPHTSSDDRTLRAKPHCASGSQQSKRRCHLEQE